MYPMKPFAINKVDTEVKSMAKNTYGDDLQYLSLKLLQTLPSSPLIREEKNLFTFSPIQDELEYF